MNSQSTPRLTGPSPERRRPRLFSRSPARVQLGDLASQPGQFQPFVGTECGGPIGSLTPFGGNPVPQRLVVDSEFSGDLADAAAAVQHQLRGSLPELLGVLAPSAHPGPPSLADAKSGGVQ